MYHPIARPFVAHPTFHARTFWVGAFTLLALGFYIATQHRAQDPDALLMKHLVLHALIGAIALCAFGLYYQRQDKKQPDSNQYFFGSTHFWLTFLGILGLMSHELLIPEATLGWGTSEHVSPGYYFLHIVGQAVFVPIGGLLFLAGQGYFLFRLGMHAALQSSPARYHHNGEVAG